MKRLLLNVTLLLCAFAFRAQAQPQEQSKAQPQAQPNEAEALFVTDKVWTLHLTLTPEAWKGLEPPASAMPMGGPFGGPFGRPGAAPPPVPPSGAGPASPPAGARPAVMRMPEIDFPEVRAAFEFEGKAIGEIGLRYKGNSSFFGARGSLKKSFKLDFNQFDKKLRFYGLTKLNLNNNFSDPSQMRESLSYEIFRAAGVAAPRTSYARVFVSVAGEHERRYLGLYTIIEQVDDRFLQRTFGSKKGLLLKPELPAGMPYLGDDAKQYETAYDAKENITPEELQRLAALTKLINQADDAEFAAQIRSFINVNAFLRFLAINALLANGDSLLSMGHNYYIYHEPKETQFYWLPWDLNMSFGGFPGIGSAAQQMDLSLLHPHAGENKLIDRLLALPEVKKAYLAECKTVLEKHFVADKLNERIVTLETALRPAIKEEGADAVKGLDRAMLSKLEETPAASGQPTAPTGPGGFRPGGNMMAGMASMMAPLKPFIAARVASAQAQLADKSKGHTPQRGGFGPMGGGLRGGPGGGRGFGGPSQLVAEPMFKDADADHDGKLTEAELNAASARWFTQWADKSKSTLDTAALAKGVSQFIQLPSDMPAPPQGMPGGGPAAFIGNMLAGSLLQAADGNQDQQLTAAELKDLFASRFAAWDGDKNKTLDQTEFASGLGGFMTPPGFGPPGRPNNN
jgi:spore coat protein CotH